MAYPTVVLAKPLERAIRHGHPWIYGRALAKLPAELQPGEVVAVERKGRALALGYAQPGHAIAVRVLEQATDAQIDTRWVQHRADRALALRVDNPRLATTDGMRLVHGENDGLPGLVVDYYAGVMVAVYDGAADQAFWQPHLGTVVERTRAAGFRVDDVVVRPLRGVAAGHSESREVTIREGDARFVVDVGLGQKTGFFLDQRDNRSYVASFATGVRVLNLFGYTGGFSVLAALAGASAVATVDVAAPAVAVARRNFALNGLDPDAYEFAAADAFEYLDQAHAAGRRFDVVVCDPPSFAPNARAVPRAAAAYRRLNEAALAVVAPGGLLATASCSSHVSTPMLVAAVAEAADAAGRTTRLLSVRGAATDHPTLPAFPEGNYLSFLLVHAA